MSLHHLLVLILSLTATAVSAEKPAQQYELEAYGKIEIGPDGTVHKLELDNSLPKAVRHLIDANVAKWRFEPILVDGRAVIASTRVSLDLVAKPVGNDEYQMSVAKVFFGAPDADKKNKLPLYPRRAVKTRLEARVLLELKLDAEGRVVGAHPYQTSLSRVEIPLVARGLRRLFEEASVEAAKTWRYELTEIVDGRPTESYVVVPISYKIYEGSNHEHSGQWQAFFPGPVTPAPWSAARELAESDTNTLDDGVAMSLDSRFKLLSDVEGKAL